jgi:hypothetical protein
VSRIDPKKVVTGMLAYTFGTFALAVLWHVVLFETQYQTFGYFEGEPSLLTGLATIVIQGLILSILFPLVHLSGTSLVRGFKFALLIGIFFWTSHVLAFIAKQTVHNPGLFLTMETVYLSLQFGLFGLLIGLIYRGENAA